MDEVDVVHIYSGYYSVINDIIPLEKAMAPHSSTCLENPMDGGTW